MSRSGEIIRPINASDFPRFSDYLNDHLLDNGRNGTPLFHPHTRYGAGWPAEKAEAFKRGLEVPVGESGWRRAWSAFGADSSIHGHVDLRPHVELNTAHRALLGIGVHRDHRGRGLGKKLVETVVSWAVQQTSIEWIDLRFVSGNAPAEALYKSCGFQKVGEVVDMFRIGGQSFGDVIMARRIRE
jgi:RimJ/RimL family protein N-acetyltransferase